jgi:hypothetical protein
MEGRTRNRCVNAMLLPARGTRPTPHPPPPGPRPDPTPVPPGPVPPGPVPPGPPPPPPHRDFCDRYPLLCGLLPLIPIPFLLPGPWAVICIIAPELCAIVPCILDPLLCVPGPPEPPHKPPEPPDKPDRPDQRTPRAIFGRVRAANTPSAMGDRIPDSGFTLVAVAVSDYDPTSTGPILIRQAAARPVDGEVLTNGARTAAITGSTMLSVAGQTQTSERAGGFNLRLEAVLGATVLGQSEPFAVSAIMENMRTRRVGEIVDPTGASLLAEMIWDSDGANGLRSLSEMEYGENLELIDEHGGMIGLGLGGHGFLALADQPQEDQHGTPIAFMSSPGRQELLQVHTLVDHRTGSLGEDIPVTNSGFAIVRIVEPDPDRPGCLRFVITKSGRAGTVLGFRSGAGTGTARLIVPLPCAGGGGSHPGPTPNGGGGTAPSTPSLPHLHHGPVPTGHVPFGYVGGVPAGAFTGLPVVMTIVFAATSTDPRHPDRQLFTAPIPCIVTGTPATQIDLETTNPVPLDLAPAGFTEIVMPAFKDISVPRRLIH